jgi:hypothetical protein
VFSLDRAASIGCVETNGLRSQVRAAPSIEVEGNV